MAHRFFALILKYFDKPAKRVNQKFSLILPYGHICFLINSGLVGGAEEVAMGPVGSEEGNYVI